MPGPGGGSPIGGAQGAAGGPAPAPCPDPELLERDAPWRALHAALALARAGQGQCVVIGGEAGVGKTRLLEGFAAAVGGTVQWLRAGCDPLHTPRPLGPLVDLSAALPPALGEAVHAARLHNGLFPELLAWMGRTQPLPVLVLEDLHWADEATLDCVRYLGRRLAAVPALLVLSHRDDEPGADAALRHVLGLLDGRITTRLTLQPLSEDAVAALAARHGRPTQGLHALTAGNPFFLSELLAAAPGTLPGSVRDAVLARSAALSAPARALAELVSAAPGGLEWELADELQPGSAAALDEAAALGLLVVRPPMIGFRHELARLAIDGATAPGRRLQIHAQLLERLTARPPAPGLLARRLHHAVQAGRTQDIVELAPAAAAEAAAVSGHRSAARMLRLALDHGAGLPARRQAELLDAWAQQCTMTQATDDALAARRQAQDLYRRLGDDPAQARQLTRLALLLTPRPEAESHARDALALLAEHPGAERVTALYALAVALTNSGQAHAARPYAQRALAEAEAAGDEPALVEALSVAAAVQLSLGPSDDAFAQLERSVGLAMALGLHAKAAATWINLASLSLAHAQFDRLLAATDQGLAYCCARELDFAAASLRVRRALGLVELARWPEAGRALDELTATPEAPARVGATAAIIRARLDTLGGQHNDDATWRGHLDAARQGLTEFLAADVAGYAAEAAWLRGDAAQARRLAAQAQAEAGGGGPWLAGRLRAWQRRAAGRPRAAEEAEPYALESAGRWRAAHDAWQALGCRYEAALALLGGDDAALRDALDIFIALGAQPAADIARRRLHLAGARDVARGPYRHARQDPWGLTARQQDVAALLVQGLDNAEIAARLHRSPRTVEHHVSAVLAKLGVSSRAQAVARLSKR